MIILKSTFIFENEDENKVDNCLKFLKKFLNLCDAIYIQNFGIQPYIEKMIYNNNELTSIEKNTKNEEDLQSV